MRRERAIGIKESENKLIEVKMISKNAMHKRMLRDFEKNFETPLMEEKKKILEDIR